MPTVDKLGGLVGAGQAGGLREVDVLKRFTPIGGPQEQAPDVRRMDRITYATSTIPALQMALDGRGSGVGDTPCRMALYDSAGALVVTSTQVVIPDGAFETIIDFPLAVPVTVPAGDYIRALHVGIPTGAQQATARAESSIVARWKLDETSGTVAIDDVGGRNGTYTGGVTLGQASLVGPGSSALFDGVDDGVDTATGGVVALHPATVTYEAWVNLDPTTGACDIVSTRGSGVGLALGVILAPLRFTASAAQGNGTDVSVVAATSGGLHHVVATADASNLRLYVDGVVTSGAMTGFTPGTVAASIGRRPATAGTFLKGRIDEASIYNAVLSAQQVSDHFAGTYRAGRRLRAWGNPFAPTVVNLLLNPQFGNAAAGTSEINTAHLSMVRITTDSIPGGVACIEMTSDGSAASAAPVTASCPSATPGKTYTAAMLLKHTNAPLNWQAGIRWFDANNVQLAGTITGVSTPVGTTGWTLLTASGVAPANTAKISPRLDSVGAVPIANKLRLGAWMVAEGSISFYGDGAQLGWAWDGAPHASTSRGPQGVINFMTNPGAEIDLTGVGPRGGAVVTRTLVEHEYGAASFQVVTGSGSGGDGLLLSSSVNVTPGGRITGGVWVKAPAAAAMRIFLLELDSANANVGNDSTNFTGTGDWQWVTVTRQFGPTGMKALFWVLNGLVAQVLTFYVDGITIANTAVLTDAVAGDLPGCDWFGTANASSSIRWMVPEVFDLYSDGIASTTGLTPAAPNLPTALAAGIGDLNDNTGPRGTGSLGGLRLPQVDKNGGPVGVAQMGAAKLVALDKDAGVTGTGVLGGVPSSYYVPVLTGSTWARYPASKSKLKYPQPKSRIKYPA